MNKIKQIEKLTLDELDKQIKPNASWHDEYRKSAYVYVGGLNYNLNEGDITIIFSQFGEIIDCRLTRDN